MTEAAAAAAATAIVRFCSRIFRLANLFLHGKTFCFDLRKVFILIFAVL